MRYYIYAVLISALSYQAQASEQAITICWEKGLKPPFLMLDEQQKTTGIAVDWLDHIFHAENLKVEHKVLPWKRCLIELQRGNVDVVPNASFKQARLQFAHYTQPIYSTHLKMFHLKETPHSATNFTDIKDFSSFSVGGVNGFNYSPFDGLLKINLGAKNRSSLLAKVEKGRLDFAILQQEVLQAMLIDQPERLAQFSAIDSPITPNQPYHALVIKNAKGEKIVSIIDKGIVKLQDSGKYQEILDSYLSRK